MNVIHQTGQLKVIQNTDAREFQLLDGDVVIFTSKPLLPCVAAFVARGGVVTTAQMTRTEERRRDRQEAAQRVQGGVGFSRSSRYELRTTHPVGRTAQQPPAGRTGSATQRRTGHGTIDVG